MEEMPDTIVYPLTAVNTTVLKEKQFLSADFSRWFRVDRLSPLRGSLVTTVLFWVKLYIP